MRHRVAHTDRYTPSLASVVRYSGRKIRAEVADELDTRYLFEVNTRGVDVRLHDLRRTARTLMSRLGVAEDLAELAIGHVRDDLVRRYNKDAAWEGRRDAFTRVSAHIEAAVGAREGAAVIPLRG